MIFDSPDLLDIQRTGFYHFLHRAIPKLLTKEFPIKVKNDDCSIELRLNEKDIKLIRPENDPRDCILKMKTYSCKLYAKIQIVSFCEAKSCNCPNEAGGFATKKQDDLKTVYKSLPEWVFLGQLPMMTKRGHFIINGAPRVVVHQVVRAPGIYFQKLSKNDDQDRARFYGDIIPLKGVWVRLQMTKKGRVEAKFKKGKKIEAAFLQRCLEVVEDQSRSSLDFSDRYLEMLNFFRDPLCLTAPHIRFCGAKSRHTLPRQSTVCARETGVCAPLKMYDLSCFAPQTPIDRLFTKENRDNSKPDRLAYDDFSKLLEARKSRSSSKAEHDAFVHTYDKLYRTTQDKELEEWQKKKRNLNFFRGSQKKETAAKAKKIYRDCCAASSKTVSSTCCAYPYQKGAHLLRRFAVQPHSVSRFKTVRRAPVLPYKADQSMAWQERHVPLYTHRKTTRKFSPLALLTGWQGGASQARRAPLASCPVKGVWATRFPLYVGGAEIFDQGQFLYPRWRKQRISQRGAHPFIVTKERQEVTRSYSQENAFKRKKCSENLFATFKIESRYDLGLLGREKINNKFGLRSYNPFRSLTGKTLSSCLSKDRAKALDVASNSDRYYRYSRNKSRFSSYTYTPYRYMGQLKVYGATEIGKKNLDLFQEEVATRYGSSTACENRNPVRGDFASNTKKHTTQLTARDLCYASLWLYKLRKGEENSDDIDHSQNRRVRTSGELLQTQFENGVYRLKTVVLAKLQDDRAMLSVTPKRFDSIRGRAITKPSLFRRFAEKNLASGLFSVSPILIKGKKGRHTRTCDAPYLPLLAPTCPSLPLLAPTGHGTARHGTAKYVCAMRGKALNLSDINQKDTIEQPRLKASYKGSRSALHVLSPFRVPYTYTGQLKVYGARRRAPYGAKYVCAQALPPRLVDTIGTVNGTGFAFANRRKNGCVSSTSFDLPILNRQIQLSASSLKERFYKTSVKELFTTKPITGALREFFGSNPLSQYMDQTNPLAEITHKRRISSLGVGGVSRESAGMAIRGIHPTHYGRICPIETPEGKNAGLVNSLAFYTEVDQNGFLKTPYYRVFKGQIQPSLGFSFCSAQQESVIGLQIAPSDLQKSWNNVLRTKLSRLHPVPVRVTDTALDLFKKDDPCKVELMAISSIQMISVATSLIPFLEHNDANRALMGSNMQRQAVPLMISERPIVGTGLESNVIVESGHITESQISGFASHVTATRVVVDTLAHRLEHKCARPSFLRTEALKLCPILPAKAKFSLLQTRTGCVALRATSLQTKQRAPLRLAFLRGNARPSTQKRGTVSFSKENKPCIEKQAYAHTPSLALRNAICKRSVSKGFRLGQNKIEREHDWKKAKHQEKRSFLKSTSYRLTTFSRSNQNTSMTEKPLLREFDWVQKGDVVTDCSASNNGELAVGKNVLVAYIPWEGYNFEDAIVISDRLVKEHVYTSLHIERYVFQAQDLKDAKEWFTKDLPGVPSRLTQHLESCGLPKIGSFLKEGDILVGKVRYLNKKPSSPYERLLCDILGEKNFSARNKSLYVPKGVEARVIYHKVLATFDTRPESQACPLRVTPKECQSFARQNRGTFCHAQKTERTACPIHVCGAKGGLPKMIFSRKKLLAKHGLFMPVEAAIEESNESRTGKRIEISLEEPQSNRGKQNKAERFYKGEERATLFTNTPCLTLLTNVAPLAFAVPVLAPYTSMKQIRATKPIWGNQFCRAKSRECFPCPSIYRGASRRAPYGAKYVCVRMCKTRPLYLYKTGIFASKICKRFGGATWKIDALEKVQAEDFSLVHTVPSPLHVRARASRGKVWRDFAPQNKAAKTVHLFLGERRVIEVGDKISGRHGNKGVISTILPRQDMPYLPDGTPIDIVLNPLGVPSRMNVGQVLESLLGLAALYLHQHFKVAAFDEQYGVEASKSVVFLKLYQARLQTGQDWLFQVNFPGKTRLIDGRSGECFDQWITVGKAYILKLIHMVSEKIHARSTGPYALITQQPLRGRSNKGGQRLGEMEVWALEGFGAAYTLQELLTKKSDDFFGRKQIVDSILPKPASAVDGVMANYRIDQGRPILGHPEIFKVLLCELQALCLDLGVYVLTPESFQRSFLGIVL